MRVGIHVEGNDYLIVRTLLAKLLDVEEQSLEVDRIDRSGLGWQSVFDQVPKTLKRFYGTCCALAVIGVDNDGNNNLLANGLQEDPRHPRHWLCNSQRRKRCRQCDLESIVEATRPKLGWIPAKPGSTWPILICVPVEMMESWLLVALAIASHGQGSLHAENESRATQKFAFYGRPAATREDVEALALPTLRSLTHDQLNRLRTHSRSFENFARQVSLLRSTAVLADACWTDDGAPPA